MIGVRTADPRYRTAVAELPLRTRLLREANGAIVVVSGAERWVAGVRAAASDGASAIVVSDPHVVSAVDVERLASDIRIPVLVERPLLREDLAADAVASRVGSSGAAVPRLVLVDAAARPAMRAVTGRDAVGWARILAGAAPLVVHADRGLALLDCGGIAATLTIVTTGRPGAGWIRGRAVGETTTEVEVEGGAAIVVSLTDRGRLQLPTRFESPARLTLRRAVGAVEAVSGVGGDRHPDDLADLAADSRIAEQIVAARA